MKIDYSKLKSELKENHSLLDYTTWRIGGEAEYFYSPVDVEDFSCVLQEFKDVPVTVLGAASNVLIRDKGIKGLVIYLRDAIQNIEMLDENSMMADAGLRLTSLVNRCKNLGMIDAAFMAGIPGTLGGALKMNAGAYGDSIWNYVKSVKTINRSGEIKSRSASDFSFSYRRVDGLANEEWFLSAELRFEKDCVEKTKEKIKGHLQKRASSQPLNLPNCGSVFRNPKNDYAARLIESHGFKGKKIGGAAVSEKHANFIVNEGGARAEDVESLIKEIMDSVEQKAGVKLIPEVEILG